MLDVKEKSTDDVKIWVIESEDIANIWEFKVIHDLKTGITYISVAGEPYGFSKEELKQLIKLLTNITQK